MLRMAARRNCSARQLRSIKGPMASAPHAPWPHKYLPAMPFKVMLQDAVDMFTEGDTPRGCLVVLSTINCTVENRGIQEYLSALRRQTLARIEARLQRGQREGDVAETAPIAAIAAFYTTVLHGLSIRAKDGATRKTLTQVVDCSMSAWDHLAKE